MQPLVSVIITCLNCKKFLAHAVNCTLSQTYENIECIIIDDGSTDESQQIAESLMQTDPRIRYALNTGDHSPAAARNFGVQQARGEWIQFYDVDDHLYPDKIKQQLDFLSVNNISDEQDMVLYSDFEVIWEDENGDSVRKITNVIGQHSREELLNKIMSWHEGPTMPFHVNSTLFKRHIFDRKIFNIDLMIFEEIEFFTDLLHNNIPFIYIPTLAMTYRIHETNLTKDSRRSRLGYIQFLNEVYNKDPSLLAATSDRVNVVMEQAIREVDQELFNKLIAIVDRAQIPFIYPWKGLNIRNITLVSLLFRIKKASRLFRKFLSPKRKN